MANRLTKVLACALLAGCVGKAPVTPPTAQQEGVVTNRLAVRLASLHGVAQAPVELLGNNSSGVVSNAGGTVVSNAGGTVVSNQGGNYMLAQEGGWRGVGSAEVVALDARRQPIPGVKAVKTDASGAFTLENVPANVVVTVQIKAGGLLLTGLAKADGTRAAVNPATTVATEHIRARLEGNEAALAHVPLEQFRQLTQQVETVLQAEGVKVPLATPEDAGAGFDVLVQSHPELREQERAVAKSADAELKKAVQSGEEATPKPSQTPGSPVTGTPTPAPAPTPTPTPAPAATATPAGSAATPTPTPQASRPPAGEGDQGGEPTGVGTPKPTDPPPGSTGATRGEAAVNRLLTTRSCPSCDLTNQDVYNKGLEGADLHGAKLAGLDAHRSRFNNANLEGADLTGADLHDADLSGANLRNAKLRNVDLHDARLVGADLTGASLNGGDLDLDDANFGSATWTDGTTCKTPSTGGCTH